MSVFPEMSTSIAPIVCFLTMVVVWVRQRFRRFSWHKLLDCRSTKVATSAAVQAELALLKVKSTAKRNIHKIVQTLCGRGFVLVALIEDEVCDLEQPQLCSPTYTILLAVSPLLLHKLSIQRGHSSVSVKDDRMQLMKQAMSVLYRCNHNRRATETTTDGGKLFEECVLLHDSSALLRTLDTAGSPGSGASPDVMQAWSSLSSPLVSLCTILDAFSSLSTYLLTHHITCILVSPPPPLPPNALHHPTGWLLWLRHSTTFRLDACGVLVFATPRLWVIGADTVCSTTTASTRARSSGLAFLDGHVLGCVCFSGDVDGVSCVVGAGDLSPLFPTPHTHPFKRADIYTPHTCTPYIYLIPSYLAVYLLCLSLWCGVSSGIRRWYWRGPTTRTRTMVMI